MLTLTTPRDHFEVWAPPDSVWSPWAKPALFACHTAPRTGDYGPEAADLRSMVGTCLEPGQRSAVVVDLPGPLGVRVGVELAEHGFRPVPMYNTTVESSAVVDCRDVFAALCENTERLHGFSLPRDAPPAFLLDSSRLTESRSRSPGAYDNRWVVFPQDFPSATFLLSQGIRSVVLLRAKGQPPMKDIDDVLARWQKGGLHIRAAPAMPGARAEDYNPDRWWGLRLFTLLALVFMGLRRNSAGGFGGRIPEQSSGGYG